MDVVDGGAGGDSARGVDENAHGAIDSVEFTSTGDAVCWLEQVCDECGALIETALPATCWRCGSVVERR